MKSPLFLIVVSLIVGVFLGGMAVSGLMLQEKIGEYPIVSKNALYELAPIETVSFTAYGEVIDRDEEKIVIERFGETLSMKLAEEVEVMIFTLPEEEPETEEVLIESEQGSLEDVEKGAKVSVFGLQEKDGSLIINMITVER